MKYLLERNGFASAVVFLVVVALLILGIGGFYASQKYFTAPKVDENIQQTPNGVGTQQNQNVALANNQFGLDLYLRYAKNKKAGENIFFSPFSISSAIGMTYEGARGITAQEIADVFHFPSDIQKLRNEYKSIYENINSKNEYYKLSVANSLWVQKDYKLSDDYIKNVKTYYDGQVTNLNFIEEVDKAVNTINSWVESKTANKIKNLLSKENVPPSTRLILTNAIYFKGEWLNKFREYTTKEKEFIAGDGSKYQTKMMRQVNYFDYAESDNIQLLKLPYIGDNLSMLVILPKNNNLSSTEKSFNYKQLNGWILKLKSKKVDISMPKFKIETKESIAEDLKSMGMPTAFSNNADFSGITNTKELSISDVIHQTFIENKEDGTEAAAATAMTMMSSSPPPQPEKEKIYIFNANHPFIFLIQQNKTGNILFMGRIAKP